MNIFFSSWISAYQLVYEYLAGCHIVPWASRKPTNSSHVRGSLHDLVRTKSQIIAENALLRQQLIVLNRSVKPPCLTSSDRLLPVLIVS
jgi:putative transposase